MATISEGVLTFSSVAWNHRKSEGGKEAARGNEAPSFTGYWQHGSSVLQVCDDGRFFWFEFGKYERREYGAYWAPKDAGGRRCFLLSSNAFASSDQSSSFGVCLFNKSGRLTLRCDRVEGHPLEYVYAWGSESDVEFERISAMPKWKPKPPSDRPSKGEKRADVLTRLGRPEGVMMWGGREALIYAWGKVWIADGIVVEMEE